MLRVYALRKRMCLLLILPLSMHIFRCNREYNRRRTMVGIEERDRKRGRNPRNRVLKIHNNKQLCQIAILKFIPRSPKHPKGSN